MVEIKATIQNEDIPAVLERLVEFRTALAADMQASTDVNPRTRTASKTWHHVTAMVGQIRAHQRKIKAL